MTTVDVLLLFSGGLDSILAARVLMEQGLSVRCLHMTSPFFGDAAAIPRWEKTYGLRIHDIDVSEQFVDMLRRKPTFGFGKILNPCVDCKILLLKCARDLLPKFGARILATGEVVGQRPMSQRRDVLHTIAREAHVQDVLLRPLSALRLEESAVEGRKLVDRTRLLGIAGRGRQDQLRLAEHFHLTDIPAPAGGCRLTERENARRYWTVLTYVPVPTPRDFRIANVGRQFWRMTEDRPYWLAIGRNQGDNALLEPLAQDEDALLTFPDIAAPVALARFGASWPPEVLAEAGALTLSYACAAIARNPTHTLRITHATHTHSLHVTAKRASNWGLPAWDAIHEALVAERKKQAPTIQPTP